jgi:hypothetical protein
MDAAQGEQKLLDQYASPLDPWGIDKNRSELPLTSILGYGQVDDCIRAMYSSKFVGDGPGRKSFEREKQAD